MTTPPITEEIIETIIYINKLIALNEFERLEEEELITQVKPEHLRTALRDYFNSSNWPSDLSHISPPTKGYILTDSITIFTKPKTPSISSWMIELDIIIDNKPSDLTAIYSISTTGTTSKIDLYAIITQ